MLSKYKKQLEKSNALKCAKPGQLDYIRPATTNATIHIAKTIFVALVVPFLCWTCDRKNEALFSLVPPAKTGITFNNRIIETDSFNIITNEYIFNGGGVAVADFNNDSLPDIFFTGNQVPNALYLNKGHLKFEDVSEIAGIKAAEKWSTGVAVVDINADGWLDVYVCAAMLPEKKSRSNVLYVNQGLGKNGVPVFKDMAQSYGVADDRNSMGATFFDYDKDGHLDLYVLNNEQVHTLPTNYRPQISDGSAASNDRLYHNNGDGTFTDVTLDAGIVHEGYGLSLAVADFNYDGWPDIHVSNDYLTNDLLYINNGEGSFSNKISDFVKHQSKFSMGSDVSDYNNDGYIDLITLDMLGDTNYRMKTTINDNSYITYILNKRYGYQDQYMRNMLHLGSGKEVAMREIGLMAGTAKTDWSWSPLFADMDNDGLRDLLVTNGFPRDITDRDFGDFNLQVHQYLSPAKILDSIPVVKIPNYAYRNKGDLTFEDVGESWGLNIPSFSNGAAFADLDLDGDLDYVVNNINDNAFLFENHTRQELAERRFLRVRLKGPKNNPLGIGAKVVLRKNDGTFLYHEHHLVRGYMSSIEPIVHFGIGDSTEVKTLEILWPDNRYEQHNLNASNQTVTIDHRDARNQEITQLKFPLNLKDTDPVLEEVQESLGIDYVHKEADVVDFNVQRTIPHKYTQDGPCLVAGDLNGDGYEDFIVGSASKYAPTIFLQDSLGRFSRSPMFSDSEHMLYEEQDMVLFDLENDGDLDLYMVSGSNEFETNSNKYIDRIFINDGNGNFTFAPERIPEIRASGSVVCAADFDNDGFTDLFVGGRTPYGQYPMAERSFLLKNHNGSLKDVTQEYSEGLSRIGMVTDAVWTDIDGDTYMDLVAVGELMPITIFKNENGSFSKLENLELKKKIGWWKSIVANDMDGDGDIDFIAGNLGRNNFYGPSLEKPVTVVVKDFDNNGSIDPITFAHIGAKDEKASYPVHFWGDLNKQSPLFRSKFNFFKEFALATKENLFTNEELENSTRLTANYDRSSYIENLGNGDFKVHELPMEVQIAPLNDFAIMDFNDDGIPDVIGVGNDYGNEVFIGRQDALNGILLKGNGQGAFSAIPNNKSGFNVPGDAKSIAKVKSALGGFYFVVSQNRGRLLVFKKGQPF